MWFIYSITPFNSHLLKYNPRSGSEGVARSDWWPQHTPTQTLNTGVCLCVCFIVAVQAHLSNITLTSYRCHLYVPPFIKHWSKTKSMSISRSVQAPFPVRSQFDGLRNIFRNSESSPSCKSPTLTVKELLKQSFLHIQSYTKLSGKALLETDGFKEILGRWLDKPFVD